MIITFPFEDDPYYSNALPGPSYTDSGSAAHITPALVQKYFDLASSVAGGVFPTGTNRFWHGGVHLKGTKPVRALADGAIVAYRLDDKYMPSQLDRLNRRNSASTSERAPRTYSGSFVLIRHKCERNNGVNKVRGKLLNRYTGAHFYSLYANLMPYNLLKEKTLLPLFLATGGDMLPVSALRGDTVTVEAEATADDKHRLVKVSIADINLRDPKYKGLPKTVVGWLERLYLDLDDPDAPLAVSQKIRLAYPVRAVYAHHPSEQQWRALDDVQIIDYPVRVGEVIGYAGKTDSAAGVLEDSFHFEIFTAENNLVKPMKPLEPAKIADPRTSYQEYQDGSPSDGMGKVWLTRNAHLLRIRPSRHSRLTQADVVQFPAGTCFLTAVSCDSRGSPDLPDSQLDCFQLFDLKMWAYYAYASQADAAADNRDLAKDAWVTLTTDSDWIARGWQAYEDKELNTTDDAFVEDDDAVMQKILDVAHKSSAPLNLADLHSAGVEAILRHVAVQFHTEWDSSHNATRYQKLKTGEHPPLPKLTDAQFNAFLKDAEGQQFWTQAQVYSDGTTGPTLEPQKKLLMSAKNWHYHPIGFLAQMRECLTTDASMSEEAFETEIRNNWNIGLKLIEKRLKQLKPWENIDSQFPSAPAHVPAPVPAPVIEHEYRDTHSINNVRHTTFWENFEYWFGIDPNTIIKPESRDKEIKAAPAGHHAYNYLDGMRKIFKHVSMQRVMKGQLGKKAGAWVLGNCYPDQPLQPAQNGFNMEYINIGCEYGSLGRPYSKSAPVDQNRMENQLHEIAHLRSTAYADDQLVKLPDGTEDIRCFNGNPAYGALAARVLAEFTPGRAMANAENIAFFIESAKYEPDHKK